MPLVHALVLFSTVFFQGDLEAVAARWTQYVQEGRLEKLESEIRSDFGRTEAVAELLLEEFDSSIHSRRHRPEQRRVRYSRRILDTGSEIARRLSALTGRRLLEKRFRARRERIAATQMLNDKEHKRALERIEEARRLAVEGPDKKFLFSTYLTSAYARLELGQTREALAECQTALTLARQIGDPMKISLALYNLSAAFLHLGWYEDSRTYSQQAAGAAQKIGNRLWEANARLNLGVGAMLAGDYRPAEEEFRKVLNLSKEAQYPLGEGRALYNLGLLYHDSQRWERARDHLERSLPFVRDVDIRHSHEIDDFNHVELEVLQLLLECYDRLEVDDPTRLEPLRQRLEELKERERSSGGHRHIPKDPVME